MLIPGKKKYVFLSMSVEWRELHLVSRTAFKFLEQQHFDKSRSNFPRLTVMFCAAYSESSKSLLPYFRLKRDSATSLSQCL